MADVLPAGSASLEENADVEAASFDKKLPEPISFGAPEERINPAVHLEQERHRARARKFGIEYVEPKKDLLFSRAELRTEIARQRAGDHKGFAVGIDLFSEEEKAKKQQRAQRYGLATAAKDEGDEERKRRLRAERFGVVEQVLPEEAATMEVDALEVRKDVPDGATLRLEAIYVYGTDTLSTKDVLHYFSAYGPSFVEWINDSSCNVVFEDEFAAKRAVLSMGTREAGSANKGLPAPWYAGKPFERGDIRLPMSLRIACTADVKPEEGVVSRHLWVRGGGRGRGRGRGGQQTWGQSREASRQEDFSDSFAFGSRKRSRNSAGQEPTFTEEVKVSGPSKIRKRGKVNQQGKSGQREIEDKVKEAEEAEPTDRFTRKRTEDEDEDDL